MKRCIIMAAMLLTTLFAGAEMLQIGFGADFKAKHNIKVDYSDGGSGGDTWESGLGLTVWGEYLNQKQNLLYGLGAGYQVPRDIDANHGGPKISFIPVYAVIKLQAKTASVIKPELLARGGYDLFNANEQYKGTAKLKGGMYWGAGCGVEIKQFVLQAIYEQCRGGFKEVNEEGYVTTGKITHSQINISIGSRLR